MFVCDMSLNRSVLDIRFIGELMSKKCIKQKKREIETEERGNIMLLFL
jgi:hypothetical protein